MSRSMLLASVKENVKKSSVFYDTVGFFYLFTGYAQLFFILRHTNPANILINILLKIHFTGVLISPLPDLLPDVFCFDGENISFDASLLYI